MRFSELKKFLKDPAIVEFESEISELPDVMGSGLEFVENVPQYNVYLVEGAAIDTSDWPSELVLESGITMKIVVNYRPLANG